MADTDVQEEQDPPEAGTLVKLCAGTFTVTNFKHMEVRLKAVLSLKKPI